MNWSVTGAVLLGVAVMIGAFGAHALREKLDAYSIGIYERAVFYHFVHALGLLAIGLAITTHVAETASANLAGWLLLIGFVVFCGSLYALALSGVRKLGAITPLGGLAFVAGWFTFAYALRGAVSPP